MALTAVRELITRLGFTIDDAEARRYEQRLKNLGRSIRGVGRTMSLFVTAPIVALGGSFIKVAADAEETESKFREVFKSIADEADATAKSLSKDFDLANTTAQEMLSSTGDILIGFGFTEKAALDLSKQVNSLAVDIASFKNVQGGAAQASNAITKALLGEREMLKGIGIAILEEDVKLKIAQLTAEGMTFATNRQAKSFATLQLVIDRSTKSIGDYARTSGSATNQARKLRQRWIELSVTLGKVLLPLFTDLVKVLSSVVEWFNSFSPAGRKAIVIIAGITAALGPLLIVLGSIATIIAAIPVLAVAAVAAVAAIGLLIGEDIAAFVEGRDSVFGLIINGVKQALVFIGDEIEKMIDAAVEYLSKTWLGWIAEHVTPWIEKIKAAAAFVGVGVAEAAETTTGQSVRDFAKQAFLATPGGAPFALGSFLFTRPATPESAQGGAITNSNVTVNMEVTAAPGESAEATGREAVREMNRTLGEAASKGAITPRMAP